MEKKRSNSKNISPEVFKKIFKPEITELFERDYFKVLDRIIYPNDFPTTIDNSIVDKYLKPKSPEPPFMYFLAREYFNHFDMFSLPSSLHVEEPDYFDSYHQLIKSINKKAVNLGLSEDFIRTDDRDIRVAIDLFNEIIEKNDIQKSMHIVMWRFISLLPGLLNYNSMVQFIDEDNKRINKIKNAINTLIKHNVVQGETHASKVFWIATSEFLEHRTLWKKDIRKYKPLQPALTMLVHTLDEIQMKTSMRGLLYEIFEDYELLGVLYQKIFQNYTNPKTRKDKILDAISGLITYTKKISKSELMTSFVRY
jgi:hypothetical protein